MRTTTPSARSVSSRTAELRGWSLGLTRGCEATSVVGTPKRAKTWAISTPVGPAPSTTRLAGSSRVLVASRLVQGVMASRPSMAGTVEWEPTAMMMFRALDDVLRAVVGDAAPGRAR